MMIQGSTPYAALAQSAGQKNTPAADPVAEFMSYMKETPAQRMEDAWLAAHHLTRKDLESMPPEKQAAVRKQMADEMKQAALDKAKNGGDAKDASRKIDVLA